MNLSSVFLRRHLGVPYEEVFLWWLITGSKGGENRARIILELKNRPYNANKLAEKLSLDYKILDTTSMF